MGCEFSIEPCRRFIVGLPATLALAIVAPPALYGADAATRADQQFTSYAYAHEFGSGVYDFNGRTLQVYGLPFGWTVATYSRVSFHGNSLTDDDFLRFRNSLEFKRDTGFALHDHPVEYRLFATVDVYADPPTGPATGIDVPRTQLETGIAFGARPAWKIWKISLPRVGLSYRFAGDVSAVGFVLGAPF